MDDKKVLSFLAGGTVGVILGGAIAFLAIQPSVNRIVQRAQDLQQRYNEVVEENRQLRVSIDDTKVAGDILIQQNRSLKATATETYSEATVLYEPTAQNSGAIGAIAAALGHPLPQVQGMAPRWFIPAKVKPTVYGDPRGMQLVYVDAQGRKEGPFAPGILPQ